MACKIIFELDSYATQVVFIIIWLLSSACPQMIFMYMYFWGIFVSLSARIWFTPLPVWFIWWTLIWRFIKKALLHMLHWYVFFYYSMHPIVAFNTVLHEKESHVLHLYVLCFHECKLVLSHWLYSYISMYIIMRLRSLFGY